MDVVRGFGPIKEMADIPVIGRLFVRESSLGFGSAPVHKFYERYAKAGQVKRTIDNFVKEGKLQEVIDRYLSREDYLQLYDQYEDMQERATRLSELRTARDEIIAAKDIDEKEKGELLRLINQAAVAAVDDPKFRKYQSEALD